jgi:FkbM family methyltransferase
MNSIKKILLAILGERRYLRLLSSGFQWIYEKGLAGINYQDIYFLAQFIHEGDYCVDIGAHLGYYTLPLSKLVGSSGKIFAVEPMSKFHDTLENFLHKKKVQNVTLYQRAIGGEGEYVEMGIPKIGNTKKFAYARVMQTDANLDYFESEKVKNESGDNLFKPLPRLDFIKCDVEGLEVPVFASMMGTLSIHHPVLVCELADQHERIKLFEMIAPFGYRPYLLRNKKLHELDVYSADKAISHNHYFIPEMRAESMKHLIS